jgi:hypothetical protein
MDILDKYELDKKFGYGSVSDLFLENKRDMLSNLDDVSYWVSLWQVVGTSCGGYNGSIDKILLDVVKDQLSEEPKGILLYGKDVDENTLSLIEIVNYMLCSEDICEYGGSPRFPWLTEYGRVVLDLYFKQDRPDWLERSDI